MEQSKLDLINKIQDKLKDGDYTELYEISHSFESGLVKFCSISAYLVIAHWFYGSINILCIVYDNKVLYESE